MKPIVLIVMIFHIVMNQVTILGPKTFLDALQAISSTGELVHKIGNFGEVPYGKTIIGYIFLQKQSDGTNYWCNYDQTSTPPDLVTGTPKEYVPIFLVDHSINCKYTQKALNVRSRGGGVMMLVYDKNALTTDDFNIDDRLGDKVDIPTVIIPKNIGDLIKEHLKQPGSDRIAISIKFVGVKSSGKVNVQLFFRSDDVKALGFFKEFLYYQNKLKDRLSFTPVYKYNVYPNEVSSNIISASTTAPCIEKPTKYCVGKNSELNIINPRIILFENIRQSCIYQVTDINLYWRYMMNFLELCADVNNPTFTEDCSMNSMKITNISYDPLALAQINQCMQNMVEFPSKIEDDYNLFNKMLVYRVPELMINGVKYRGNWLGKNIFNAICNGFFDNEDICASMTPDDIKSQHSLGYKIAIVIGIVLFIITILLLCCYRRIVNKSLEMSLSERIQQRTIKNINEYKAFKEDSDSGERSKDENKLEMGQSSSTA